MKQFLARKRLLALSGLAAVAITAVAVAYFSTGGSGSGNGTVSETAPEMTLSSATVDWTELGETKNVAIVATNSGTSPQRVDEVTITDVEELAGCPDGSFVAGNVAETGNEVPADGGSATVANVDVTFTNLNEAQNACLGSGDKVTFHYSATAE